MFRFYQILNVKCSELLYFWSYSSIFFYRSSRILFLFYLTIILINISNTQGKSKSLKNSIEYILLRIESRKKERKRETDASYFSDVFGEIYDLIK